MALLYPWAEKEYLLWKMSLGQIILYYNLGTEMKYGKGERETPSLKNLSHDELKKLKNELREQYGEIDA